MIENEKLNLGKYPHPFALRLLDGKYSNILNKEANEFISALQTKNKQVLDIIYSNTGNNHHGITYSILIIYTND